jgi:hypothetical protein
MVGVQRLLGRHGFDYPCWCNDQTSVEGKGEALSQKRGNGHEVYEEAECETAQRSIDTPMMVQMLKQSMRLGGRALAARVQRLRSKVLMN